jgi:DNA-binding NtrC family response regulator
MARSRTKPDRLVQTLDDSIHPLFVVDEQREIVFWNEACADWTRHSADRMLGQKCVYQAPDAATDPAVALAAALCPPPEAFSGLRRRVWRALPLASGGAPGRWIEYLPLRDGADGAASVLALVDAVDTTVDAVDPAQIAELDANNEELHRQLARFRAGAIRKFVPESLVGNHPAIFRARAQAALAARGRESVLIFGPAGVGKDHLARTIHYQGLDDRSGIGASKLIPLACSTVGAELLSSTLRSLGAKRPRRESPGAKTPANESPDTLLLGDVDQMPLDAQRQLAEMLSSGELTHRLLSTTTRRLETLVAENAFDERLACLLSTLTIDLPPLAQRLGDLPLLAQALVEAANVESDKQFAGFAPETLDLLASHNWTGNIDELRKLVIEAHKLAEPPEIKPRDIAKRLLLAQEAATRPGRAAEPIELEKLLAEIERELITRALSRSKGNKSRAARLLGLTRPRLYRRMVQLGLEEPPSSSETPIFEPM